jgi:hypothetical protein
VPHFISTSGCSHNLIQLTLLILMQRRQVWRLPACICLPVVINNDSSSTRGIRPGGGYCTWHSDASMSITDQRACLNLPCHISRTMRQAMKERMLE